MQSQLKQNDQSRDTAVKGTQKLSNYAYDIKKRISTIFDEEALNNLARKTKFVRRSTSKLQGAEFVELLTTEMLEEPNISYEALCEILAKDQRLNNFPIYFYLNQFSLNIRFYVLHLLFRGIEPCNFIYHL